MTNKDIKSEYERGYNDGWEAGQQALGVVSAEVFDWLMCDDGCNSPEEHIAHNDVNQYG